MQDIVILIIIRDDPISLIESLPSEAAQKNANVAFVITKRGGHCGWLQGWWFPSTEAWVEKIVVEFAKAVEKHHYQESISTVSA